MLKKIAESRYLNFLSGLILVITAGYETWHTLEHLTLGTHHGVLLFGFIQMIKSIPEMLHACKEIQEAKVFNHR